MTNHRQTVLLAVDGTDSDRSVIRQTIDLFGLDQSYLVVSVVDEPMVLGAASVSFATASAFSAPSLSAFADGLDVEASTAEDIAARVAESTGLDDADQIGEVGDPATVLLDVAADHDVDVIVVGASERSWLSRLFDPSVEAAVVDRATCPVLVVHPNR